MLKYIILFAVGAGLLACSSVNTITLNSSDSSNADVLFQGTEANVVDSMVYPYKHELEDEMNEVIAYAERPFEKGRPGGALNNWAADALLESQIGNARLSGPTFSLLNVGGLRNTINEGDVTLGDLLKVMPFDNEVVWVEMPVETLTEIAEYLTSRNGEPIGGAYLRNGKLEVDGVNANTKTVWILTSDYLLNGGDNMTFFEKKVSVTHSNELLRDAFIRIAKKQKLLNWSDELRIKI
ncbi:MAG: 5'-nucleotidase C-terminal domain-containing protein [Crocinitomicaceae bacterium]|nr:5'-nucleotidase C-terminal domain-containing protein [Crocinitomicaceae bacterium]